MAKRAAPGGVTPSAKKTGDESGETFVVCVTCNKNAEDDSIECENCLKWEHRECARISKDEYKILNDSSPNLMFFCTICRPKVKLALKFFNEIDEKLRSFDEKVKTFEVKLNSASNQMPHPLKYPKQLSL